MSDGSSIEWTDATWNPLLGCSKVSPGCDGCYAISTARIRESNPNPKISTAYDGIVHRDPAGLLDWTGQVNLLPARLMQPLRWQKPRRIFVNSQSDLFHDQVPDDFIIQVLAVIGLARRHTFQLLTKRHGRMRSLLGRPGLSVAVQAAMQYLLAQAGTPVPRGTKRMLRTDAGAWMPYTTWPLPNLWLGVSVENQQWADTRIPALLQTPAAVRWLSCEPLLGPVDVAMYLDANRGVESLGKAIDWVVVGGESGPNARPMHPHWARWLLGQCENANVPFLFKQWGQWASQSGQADSWLDRDPDAYVNAHDGRVLDEHGALDDGGTFTGVYRVGKKAAGRELDGRTWDQYPAGVA